MVAQREKFGKLVLLELTETTGLGPEYRAAKLGPAGLEKIVTILRLSPGVSGNAEVARSLMDQAKVAAQLQNGNILKIFGIGKVDQTYYISYEFVEGKSLRAVLDRCRQESFPLQVEHALLITSKVCSALEYAQTRKGDNGRYFHGLVNPGAVLVTYEGEVRVKGFGYWPSRVREVLGPEELRYIAPEQRTGVGEPRSDIFGVGAVLFECLTGAPPPTDGDPASQVAAARLLIPQGDDDKIPAPVAEILRKSLAADPAARYPDVQDMRKALDTLLFSGDFTPTTFNLAFFMHSLYREDIEREAKRLKEDREASYLEFLTEEPGRPAPAPPARPVAPAPPPPKAEAPEPRPAPARAEAVASAPAHVEAPAPHPTPGPSRSDPHHGAGSREAASAFTFHKDKEEKKSGMGLVVPLALLVLLGGGAAYYFLVMKPAAPAAPAAVAAPPTVSPETAAAQARIQELEDKLKALEEEKAQAEAKAADDAKKKVEAQAAARGQAVDPEAIERAQEEARRKAKAEQEKRQLEETRRLEEQKRAEEQRIADERKRAEDQARAAEQARQEQAAAAAAAAAAPPPPTEAPSTPAPVKAGTLVSLNDPGVVAPVVERQPTLVYPPIALRQRVDGTVELNALVDEKGNVADVAIVTPAGGRAGLNEAATESVKRRKYRPATKDGVPVRVWIQVRVRFELPK